MIICNNEGQFRKWVDDKITSLDKFMSELVAVDKFMSELVAVKNGIPRGAINGVNWQRGTARTYSNFVISVNAAGDTTIYNTKTGKSGKAHRNPDDAVDYRLGLALAWARYNHKEIPMIRKTVQIRNLKVGDVVNLGEDHNFIVLSVVPVTEERDTAVTLMSWTGKRSSFYHATTITRIMHKMGIIDVVDHVKF